MTGERGTRIKRTLGNVHMLEDFIRGRDFKHTSTYTRITSIIYSSKSILYGKMLWVTNWNIPRQKIAMYFTKE